MMMNIETVCTHCGDKQPRKVLVDTAKGLPLEYVVSQMICGVCGTKDISATVRVLDVRRNWTGRS